MKKHLQFLILIAILNPFIFGAVNQLSVQNPGIYGHKPGYIDRTLLVIEPHGSYVEQSLYIEYSEHNQFSAGNQIEIVHRFELPEDAVVNDLWLWIGDSIMQAKMFDTWTARGIYDSIVAVKRDPAFLSKTGNQYELKVYPLNPGGTRKIKLNYIVPTKWAGNKALTELPLRMLKADNSTKTPLEIAFRTKEDIWGKPKLEEFQGANFSYLLDTLNYSYLKTELADIKQFSFLNLSYETDFKEGVFIKGFSEKQDTAYFQVGISPTEFFDLKPDSTKKDVLIAMDFSGSYNVNLNNNIDNISSVMKNALKPVDRYKVLFSGAGFIGALNNNLNTESQQSVELVLKNFKGSILADSIKNVGKKRVLFCDEEASINWKFDGIEEYADVKMSNSIVNALHDFHSADIISAYRHGYDSPIDQNQAGQIIPELDSLFQRGGRFLTYHDFNRNNQELLATHYINGLRTKAVNHSALTLYRNEQGNIGYDFPEQITRNSAYFFEYDDPDVKIELMDASGNPTVISKKIKNGLLVVTGMWSLRDDAGLKKILGIPLLGLSHASNKKNQLKPMLERIKAEYANHKFDKVFLVSNSDTLFAETPAREFSSDYINSYNNQLPVFNTINLIDSENFSAPSITVNLEPFFGSGYLLNRLAELSGGLHVEKDQNNWTYIKSLFPPYPMPGLSEFNLNVTADGGTVQILDFREVNKNLNDQNKPRFYLGQVKSNYNIDISIQAKLKGVHDNINKSLEYIFPHDTTDSEKIISSMLGYERLKDYFRENVYDTSAIVKLAMKYNLLCDYTSLLALEPNEKIHFMRDPLDELDLTDVEEDFEIKDSLSVDVYPNPFNNQTKILVTIPDVSELDVIIYDILGREVKRIYSDEAQPGVIRLYWNGTNNFDRTVSSGLYLLRTYIKNSTSNKAKVYSKKLMYVK